MGKDLFIYDKPNFPVGVIAELMAKNFFKKMAIDQGLKIGVVDADPEQDRHKIDFIIKRVKSDDLSDSVAVGVQFTAGARDLRRNKKIEIENHKQYVKDEYGLSDLILSSIPSDVITISFRKWELNGRPSGGPDAFLPTEDKRKLFKSVLSCLFTEEEVDAMILKYLK